MAKEREWERRKRREERKRERGIKEGGDEEEKRDKDKRGGIEISSNADRYRREVPAQAQLLTLCCVGWSLRRKKSGYLYLAKWRSFNKVRQR
jgi:hypothetical protein